MPGQYCAFLLRCWQLEGGAQRVEITHIQSGERARLASLAAALAWLAAHQSDAVGEQSAAERTGAVRGREGKGGP
ncbi:MAG: hypothetical protein M3Q65_21795 [Chloroflexota bacterium]|nr:hypothetical protein [Chloroflexota bacterium]